MRATVFGSAVKQRGMFALFPVAALALSGCGSNNGVACPLYFLSPPPLLSPANGSTGISDSIRTIRLGAVPNGVTLTLVSTAGAVALGPLIPISGSTDVTVAVPQLSPATTYRVVATGLAASCGGPPAGTATSGSFTTQ